MQALNCPNCGAALPQKAIKASDLVSCEFCGTSFRVPKTLTPEPDMGDLILGADFYEKTTPDPSSGKPAIGIGDNSVIENAIIDKNARVGANVRLVNEAKAEHADGPCWHIRDGIIIVPKDTIVPEGTVV